MEECTYFWGVNTSWGINMAESKRPLNQEDNQDPQPTYIIIVVDYFTKWVEAMPMFKDDGETGALFLFNQIIARFGVPREIITDHGSHF
jgi:hypothetical protein